MILPLRIQKQLLHNWCWAAATSSISFYYYKNTRGWHQGQLAGRLLDNSCGLINPQNAGTAPDVCDTVLDIAQSLSLSGNYAGEQGRPLNFQEVISQINAGHPLCCQLFWPGLDGSHFVIVYGYESNQLIVGDPDPIHGGSFPIDYNMLLSDYRSGGQWVRTIGTRAPHTT